METKDNIPLKTGNLILCGEVAELFIVQRQRLYIIGCIRSDAWHFIDECQEPEVSVLQGLAGFSIKGIKIADQKGLGGMMYKSLQTLQNTKDTKLQAANVSEFWPLRVRDSEIKFPHARGHRRDWTSA